MLNINWLWLPFFKPSPGDGRVVWVTEGFKIHDPVRPVAMGAGEGFLFGNHPVVDGPVHKGIDEFDFAAVFEPGFLHAVRRGSVPVKVRPETLPQFRDNEVAVFGIGRLYAGKKLIGGDPGLRISDVSHGWIQIRDPIEVHGIPVQIPPMLAVVPGVDRLNVLSFDKNALLFAVGGDGVGILRQQFNGLSRLGPVPEHEGGFVPGKCGNMTGLTRDGVTMGIQGFEQGVIIIVGLFVVTVRAGDAPLADGGGGAATRDFVLEGHMTFLAGEILAAHVNILQRGGMLQGAVQISVLDGIPAAAEPVA